jgi:methylmalonyl-CoA mutase
VPETGDSTDVLNLRLDFPPVDTATWEAAIAQDLKAADSAKKLVWQTEEGLAICPYYRKEALTGLDAQLRTAPGEYPFVRGMGRSWEIAPDVNAGPNTIRADLLHEAGAHAIQELGYGVAAGVERLAELTATLPVDVVVGQIEFVFAVGPGYFIEIAKLRAARMLWAQAVAAFGAKDAAACRMRLHVRTPRRNKSAYNRYTNLLRVTTEALAAVVGGCDRLTVEPFGFDPHLALNVQRILQEESHLDAVADPAGGSYYIETLTDSMAREAWKLLQQVEAEGGYARALASGSIAKALAETRSARAEAYATRRRTLVGVNNYPNLTEKTPASEIPDAEPGSSLPEARIAMPFEKIRRRTTEHAQATGRYPKVLLLKRGDAKLTSARANFCLNFLGCGGFDLVESEEYQGTDADLIVLCSSDPEYPALAKEVCPRVKVPVLVAGNPKQHAAALQSAGVQGFLHSQSDMIATLTEWQDRLGMRTIA